jgi:hypothetical protein
MTRDGVREAAACRFGVNGVNICLAARLPAWHVMGQRS